eukprot:TRINITY_DN11481_c1_g1_i1.p1 TRINITY_DN11481_c1_g1~~TRINITY_DN11481_c1_g1_i1.p1  ORF type:complete len:957 (+),score=267.83 TRINITY_DN11481_c1_g1_i1:89-2959(+)
MAVAALPGPPRLWRPNSARDSVGRSATPAELADSGLSLSAVTDCGCFPHRWSPRVAPPQRRDQQRPTPTFLTEARVRCSSANAPRASVPDHDARLAALRRPNSARVGPHAAVRRIDLRIPKEEGALSGFTSRCNSATSRRLDALAAEPVPPPVPPPPRPPPASASARRPPPHSGPPAGPPAAAQAQPERPAPYSAAAAARVQATFAATLRDITEQLEVLRPSARQARDWAVEGGAGGSAAPSPAKTARRGSAAADTKPRSPPPPPPKAKKRISAEEQVVLNYLSPYRGHEANMKILEERVLQHQMRRRLSPAGSVDWAARNRAALALCLEVHRQGGPVTGARRAAAAAPGDRRGVAAVELLGFGESRDGMYAATDGGADCSSGSCSGSGSEGSPPRAVGHRDVVYVQQEVDEAHTLHQLPSGWWALSNPDGDEVARAPLLEGHWSAAAEICVAQTTGQLCQQRAQLRWEERKQRTLRRIDRKMLNLSKQERVEYQHTKHARAKDWARLTKLVAMGEAARSFLILGRTNRALERREHQLQRKVAAKFLPVVRERRRLHAQQGWAVLRRCTAVLGFAVRARKRRSAATLVSAVLRDYAESLVFVKAMMRYRRRVVKCQRVALAYLQRKTMRILLDILSLNKSDTAAKGRAHKEYLIQVRREELRRQREANARSGSKGRQAKGGGKKKDPDKGRAGTVQILQRRWMQLQGVQRPEDAPPQLGMPAQPQGDLASRIAGGKALPPLTEAGQELLAADDAPSSYPIPFSIRLRLIKEDHVRRDEDYAKAQQEYRLDLIAYDNTLAGLRSFDQFSRNPKKREPAEPPPKPHLRFFLWGRHLQRATLDGLRLQREMEDGIKQICARFYPDSAYNYMHLRDTELRRVYEQEHQAASEFFQNISRICRGPAQQLQSTAAARATDMMQQEYAIKAICGKSATADDYAQAWQLIDEAAASEPLSPMMD